MNVSYLTDDEKRAELDRLAVLIPTANHAHDNGLDVELVPWIRRFNQLPGIVTIQSCEGHRFWHGGHEYKNRAYIAFRYSLAIGRQIRLAWEAIPDLPQHAHASIDLREPDPESGRREEWFAVWFDGQSGLIYESPDLVMAPLLDWLRGALWAGGLIALSTSASSDVLVPVPVEDGLYFAKANAGETTR